MLKGKIPKHEQYLKDVLAFSGQFFFRLPFPSDHFWPYEHPDITLQFVAAPVQFFPAPNKYVTTGIKSLVARSIELIGMLEPV